MSISKRDLIGNFTVKTEEVKLTTLRNSIVTIKELTVDQTEKFNKILKDESKDSKDAMYYAVKCAMVEPEFFTDEELEQINNMPDSVVSADIVISEIYSLIPIIGKTEEEKKKYYELVAKVANSEKREEPTKEEIEKK